MFNFKDHFIVFILLILLLIPSSMKCFITGVIVEAFTATFIFDITLVGISLFLFIQIIAPLFFSKCAELFVLLSSDVLIRAVYSVY